MALYVDSCSNSPCADLDHDVTYTDYRTQTAGGHVPLCFRDLQLLILTDQTINRIKNCCDCSPSSPNSILLPLVSQAGVGLTYQRTRWTEELSYRWCVGQLHHHPAADTAQGCRDRNGDGVAAGIEVGWLCRQTGALYKWDIASSIALRWNTQKLQPRPVNGSISYARSGPWFRFTCMRPITLLL